MSSENKPTTLSHSSSILINKCEQKYSHYKIEKTERDFPFDSSRALIIGKVVHETAEELMHLPPNNISVLEATVTKNLMRYRDQDAAATSYYPIIFAMVKEYLSFHKKSGVRVVACEYEINDPINGYLGYIDIILADEDDNFYIADLKTKSRFSLEREGAALYRNQQLHMYGNYHQEIAKKYGLKDFLGYLYRVVKTPLIRKKKGESNSEFLERLNTAIKIEEVFIPHKQETIDEVLASFKSAQQKRKELESGRKPTKNFNECLDMYGGTCPWFSKCYGKTHKELTGEVMYRTSDEGNSMSEAYSKHSINKVLDDAFTTADIPDI